MAFDINKFSPAGANSDKGVVPQQFSYIGSSDTIAQMIVAGYFNGAAFQLFTNDMISAIASDGMAIFHVKSSSITTGSGNVVLDSNVISNQGGSDSSVDFHNIYQLSDFPVQDDDIITLENGVNYLVYMPSPVNTTKRFQLASSYAKGGSLIYMGGPGKLIWNWTAPSNKNWLSTASAQGGGPFTLKGFDLIDVNAGAFIAVQIVGTSESSLFDRVTIEDCIFTDFAIMLDIVRVDRVSISNVHTNIINEVPDETFQITECANVRIKDCDLEGNSEFRPALKLELVDSGQGLSHAHIENCQFILHEDSQGALEIPQISTHDGAIVVSNCVSRDTDGAYASGFVTEHSGSIEKVENGSSGKVKVTTYLFHGISNNDKVALFGTNDYNGTNFTASSASGKTFEVPGTFTSINYAGGYVVGSLDPFTSPDIVVSGGIGFEGRHQMGTLRVNGSSQVQTFTAADTYQKINFSTSGEIQGPVNALLNDFMISDYNNVELKYQGSTAINARLRFITSITKGTASSMSIIFRPNGDGARDTGTITWALGADGSYSCEAVMAINPDEAITAFIKGPIISQTVSLKDVYFTITE